MATDFTSALVSRNYSAAIKFLDAEIKQTLSDNSSRVLQLLCNRAYCYEQLQLHRRAAKVGLPVAMSVVWQAPALSCKYLSLPQDYEEAIKSSVASGQPSVHALVQQGLLLHKLKKGDVRADSATSMQAEYAEGGLLIQLCASAVSQ